MRAHPSIKQVVIVFQSPENTNAQQQMQAYYTTFKETKLEVNDLRDFLKASLPSYMIPDRFIKIDAFPINTNGKIDRQMLPQLPDIMVSSALKLSTPKNSIEQWIVKQVAEITKFLTEENIDTSKPLSLLGMDSIRCVSFISKIRQQFSVQLSAFQLLQENIQEIARHIDSIKNIDNESLPLTEMQNGNSSEICLKLMQKGDESKPPLILIHPASGAINCYEALVKELDDDQPCYAIEDPSLSQEEILFSSVPEMAKAYLQLIQEQLSDCKKAVVAGWSFGGMVALEIAEQARYESSQSMIKGAILLDTWQVSALQKICQERLKKEVLAQYHRNLPEDNRLSNTSDHLYKIFAKRQEQGFIYKRLQPAKTNVILLKARERSNVIRYQDFRNYWKMGDNMTTQTVTGDHDSILQQPNLSELASKVSKAIISLSEQPSINHLLQRYGSFSKLSSVLNPTDGAKNAASSINHPASV